MSFSPSRTGPQRWDGILPGYVWGEGFQRAIPVREFAFYAFGFVAILLAYVWADKGLDESLQPRRADFASHGNPGLAGAGRRSATRSCLPASDRSWWEGLLFGWRG
jgi:hypothetical protein